MQAFVYSWKNKTTGRLYIGWHKGSSNDGYVCSSRILLEEYSQDPNNFERFIIADGSVEDMVALESAILKAVDAKNNPKYYNQHNGDGKFCHTEAHTEEAKRKMSLAKIGKKPKPFLDKHRANISKSAIERSRNGEMMILANRSADLRKGKPLTDEHIVSISKSMIGKNRGIKRSLELRKRMSEARIGVKRGPYRKRINNDIHHESPLRIS